MNTQEGTYVVGLAAVGVLAQYLTRWSAGQFTHLYATFAEPVEGRLSNDGYLAQLPTDACRFFELGDVRGNVEDSDALRKAVIDWAELHIRLDSVMHIRGYIAKGYKNERG